MHTPIKANSTFALANGSTVLSSKAMHTMHKNAKSLKCLNAYLK